MQRSNHPLWAHMRVVVATVLAVLAIAMLPPRPALAIALKPITVTISRVTQTGPHNGYDELSGTASDFFARVFIDSTTAVEGPRIDDNDDIFPNWAFSKTVPKQQGRIAIRIEIWDFNGIWPSMIVDVDPTPCDPVFGCTTVTTGSYPTPHPPLDSRGLDLILDLNTGAVSSDASSRTTCVKGDDANLCFSISVGSDIFVPTTLTVTKAADTNDGVCNSDCSLREALSVATDDDTIIVPPDVYTLTFVKLPSEPGHLVVRQKGLKIIGPQTGGTAIIEQAPPSSSRPNVRVFEVASGAEVEFRNLTIRNGIADNNSAVLAGHIHGGGIHNHGKMRLINVTLTNNQAPIDDGGGIYTAGGSSSELLNVTIAGNSALRNAAGIAGSGNSLKNTILANNNLTNGIDANCAVMTIDNGNNLQFPGTTCGNITTADPRLKPATDGVYDLGPGSAAIDAGDNSSCPTQDQRGSARPLDGNGDGVAVCDIGAIEDFLGVLRQPLDQASGTRPVTLSFDTILTAGTSSLVISAKGTAPPTGFLRGSPASYYALKTTAEFARTVQICIDYPASAFTSEAALKLFRLDTAWVNVTESLDTTNDTICGRDSKLGTFAIFQQNTPP